MGANRTAITLDLREAALTVTSPESPVDALVGRHAVEVAPGASLADAADVMAREGVSALLVDEARAIVTERDIARAVAAGIDAAEPVSTVATPHPLTIDGRTSVVEAAATMLNEDVRHLVVRLADGSAGMLSLRDVVAVLLRVADPARWLSSLRVTLEAPSEVWIG